MSDKPPVVNEILIRILKSWYDKGKRSAHIPDSLFDAAQWWINLQEPADEYRDRPEPQVNKDGEQTGWLTPYHDRLAYNLRKFLGMSDTHKAFIIDRIRAGIPYRGDDIDFYKLVCDQELEMVKDPGAYIQKAIGAMRTFAFANPTE